jgi:hypothetical protein
MSSRRTGFSIRGKRHSRANPRVEWDLNIDELMAGTTRIAGISAGTFDVVGHERKPRSPIVELNFLITGVQVSRKQFPRKSQVRQASIT